MSISSSMTITTAALKPIQSLLAEKGLSSNDIFENFGLDARFKGGGSSRISIPKFDQIIEYVGRAIDEPAIGLLVGERFHLDEMYLLSFLVSNCNTPRDILSVLRRYYTLISENQKPDFFIGQDQIKIVFYSGGGAPLGNQIRTEFITAAAHSICKTVARQYLNLINIGFSHSSSSHREQLQDYFGVPIQYNQSHNWITLSARHIDSPLFHANPLFFSTLKNNAQKALNDFETLGQFSRKVMYMLHEWPETVPMTKDCVAELLSTSSRTLTRRLQEEDCQFSNLVKEVRLDKAKFALTSATTDVQQLALNLGFSDRRGFERAFKQWTGVTPAAYRRHNSVGISQVLQNDAVTHNLGSDQYPETSQDSQNKSLTCLVDE